MEKSENSLSFKSKDIFTLINLLVSLFSVILSIQGEIQRASMFILLAWFLDGLDGLVARWTKSANRFGAQFDNLVDLFSFSVAPSFVIYASYLEYSKIWAVSLCFFIISVGTIRLARFQTKPLHVPGYWIGFARPASGLFIIFLLNSKLFLSTKMFPVGAVLIIFIGLLSLSYLPYKSNKAQFTRFQIFLIFFAPISSMLMFPFGYFWDIALFFMIVYILVPWTATSAAERADIKTVVRRWKESEGP